jgi:hypothetical protein
VHAEEPDPPEMVVGLQPTMSPLEGEAEAERVTVPVKPFCPDTTTLNVPVDPAVKETLDGVVEIPKSFWPESLHAVSG